MVLKKQEFKDDEIPIFDEACVYKRGEYWQFRLWLPKENKYARKSLRTRSETTAVERGKAAYLEIYSKVRVTFQSPLKRVLRSTYCSVSVTLSLDT